MNIKQVGQAIKRNNHAITLIDCILEYYELFTFCLSIIRTNITDLD
jgi:hypothetical protein